jgi:hypothetical protein
LIFLYIEGGYCVSPYTRRDDLYKKPIHIRSNNRLKKYEWWGANSVRLLAPQVVTDRFTRIGRTPTTCDDFTVHHMVSNQRTS